MATRFEQEPQVEQRRQNNINSQLKNGNRQNIFQSDLPPIPVEPTTIQHKNNFLSHISNNGGDSISINTSSTCIMPAVSCMFSAS